MTRLLHVLLAVGIGLLVGSLTAFMIALVMVTFSISSTPNWTLGVWFLWVCVASAIIYRYVRKVDF